LAFPKISPTLFIKANRRLLTSVMSSIIDNAVKYSSGPAELTLNVEAKPRSVIIEIKDRGIGISAKEQKRIFKRFYRAGDPLIEARAGAGLGLYFARLAVRAQGGNISVHSDGLGTGSTFKIEVPL
jgi:signal transduction histidine kinase